MCCKVRVDRNSTQKLCYSTAENCEHKNPLMLSVGGCREQESPLCGSICAIPSVSQEMVKRP